MKSLKVWLKSKIKNFLLFLIRQLDKDNPSAPILRLSSGNIFNKDINISSKIVVPVTFLCLWFMLGMQIGINYKTIIGIFVSVCLTLFSVIFICYSLFFKSYKKICV